MRVEVRGAARRQQVSGAAGERAAGERELVCLPAASRA